MKFGYVRVSTKEQSVESQIDQIMAQNVHPANIFTEHISGASKNRKEFKKLIKQLQPGDILVVTELSRLGRSTRELINTGYELFEKNIELLSLKENIDTTTAAGKLMYTVLCALAEFERERLKERTKAGLESARARGRSGGRPVMNYEKIEHAIMLYEGDNDYSVSEICKIAGVSKPTLYKYLKKKKEKSRKAVKHHE